jgi:hypothetical protein
MPISIVGDGSITGLTVGGLPDSSVIDADLATGISSSKLSGALPAISGASLTNFPVPDLTTQLNAARNDIATLALHSAVADNKAAYNLTNSFVDQFEDSSGILTNTDVTRNTTSEFCSTVSSTLGSEVVITGQSTPALGGLVGFNVAGFNPTLLLNGVVSGASTDPYTPGFYDGAPTGYTDGYGCSIGTFANMGIGFVATKMGWYSWSVQGNGGRFKDWKIQTQSAGGSWVDASSVQTASNSDGWKEAALTSEFTVAATNDNIRVTYGSHYNGSGGGASNCAVSEVRMNGKFLTIVDNATGTLISNVQTANAAQTKVSGVLLYKNNAGTATLNTDFKLYFSCDNGTNWTQSTMTSGGTFSTGVLIAKGAEVTCTSGTSIKYKVEWVNQASGTKETQLHGIGMNY